MQAKNRGQNSPRPRNQRGDSLCTSRQTRRVSTFSGKSKGNLKLKSRTASPEVTRSLAEIEKGDPILRPLDRWNVDASIFANMRRIWGTIEAYMYTKWRIRSSRDVSIKATRGRREPSRLLPPSPLWIQIPFASPSSQPSGASALTMTVCTCHHTQDITACKGL